MHHMKTGQIIQEVESLVDHDREPKLAGLGVPVTNHLCSWKDYLAIFACLWSLTVGLTVVFEPRFAAYFGETRQFIWVGLALTIM